ncbi:MAG TPA: YidC/Oxa1 family membrane protein insertase, partial [Planctomycetota bacterium]|nr:YidC/Oxa1 family membrane protein insertase [Planctomycetota bacterium]
FFPRGGPDGDKAPFIDRALATSFPDPGFIAREAAEQGADVRRLPADLARELADDAYKNVRTAFTSVLGPLAPQGSLEHTYGCFAAPRESSNFAPYDHLGFGSINDYGKLHILVAFFIRLLDFLHTIAFGSWGFAIILLTFIVKLCLHPLNRRSQRAMMRAQKKMQALKPAMDEIKERYGSDRLAMQREMQRLFREHNFNPAAQLGGCLIIFLQLPIWIGLYNTLGYAIGLRHAGFLWIDDLTQPDRLIEFGRPILFVSSLNILPILYVILTVINQRLQPRPSDPQLEAQFKMMTFMLIFFGVIFYGFPAGFMLYIMTSAALGIFESKLIKSQIAKEVPAEPAVASATAGPAYRAPRPVAAERGTQQSFRERKKRKRRR